MKKKIWILSIILFLLVLLGIFLPGTGIGYRDEWCIKCGQERRVTNISFRPLPFEYIIREWTSLHPRILHKFLVQVNGHCKEHAWKPYHGGRKGLLGRTTWSGIYPPRLEGLDDGLEFLLSNDLSLLKEILTYFVSLSVNKNWKERDVLKAQMVEMIDNRDIEKWRLWWLSYKNRNI